ncbi:MAG TPA: hypothetical protein VE173_15225, partial [Longimicrobiales bacterium]|nr:hypothetical protein [Longimicrobiales bacterium]
MKLTPVVSPAAALVLSAVTMVAPVPAQQTVPTPPAGPVDPSLYQALRWRSIGPHRGGRTK